jgi:sugar lactone lactonase YvrE
MSASRLAVTILLATAAAGRADTAELVAGGLTQPFAVAWKPDGTLLFVQMRPESLLAELHPKHLRVLAGADSLDGPHDLLVAPDGGIFVADTFGHAVRKWAGDSLPRFAGTGERGFAGDGGPAAQARFDEAYSIALSRDGKQLYVVDLKNRRVRRIELATSVIHPFAGNGTKGEPKDGRPTLTEPLTDPRAVAVDSQDNVYILERGGHRLRVVRPDGTIHTVAGTGKPGKGGDGGPALLAAFNGPKYLAVDRDDTVLVCDTENHQVRRYVPKAGTVELVAGSGAKGSAGIGGPAAAVQLARPHGVAVHPKTGEVYIADSDNGRILRLVRSPKR